MKPIFLTLAVVFASSLRSVAAEPAPPPRLPRLLDLGATKCVPCKLMAPILDELGKDYAGQLTVVFIDVLEKREEGERYGVRIIPTQIFYDATGKERFRHEGFISKTDILAKWTQLGVELKAPAPAPTSEPAAGPKG